MEKERQDLNNIDLSNPEKNVSHKKKKKHKKNNEYHDLSIIEKKLFPEHSTLIHQQKKKNSEENCSLNVTEDFGDNFGISVEKHKKKHKINEENQRIIEGNIFLLNSDKTVDKQRKKKTKENTGLSEEILDNNFGISVEKHEENQRIVEENVFLDHSDNTSIHKKRKKNHKKAKENTGLNITEEFVDNNFGISVEKQRERHEINEENQKKFEGNIFLGHSIDKQGKKTHKKAKENSGLNLAKKNQDLHNINHGCSEFNIAHKNKKHKKNKECQDLSILKETIVLDGTEITSADKEKNKKAKRRNLNKTQQFSDDNSDVLSRKKYTTDKESHDLNSIFPDTSEFNLTNKTKHKKNKANHDLDITKNVVFNDSEVTSINKQTIEKHKMAKKSHDLNKTEVFAENNSKIITGKKRKINEETLNLNNIQLGNPELNVNHKIKKKHKKNKDYFDPDTVHKCLSILKKSSFFDDSEISPIAKKIRKMSHKNAKGSPDLNMIEKLLDNNSETIFRKSPDLSNIDLDSSELNLSPENKNDKKENNFLNHPEITSIDKKKHKKAKDSSDLNTTEGFADNSKIISDEKHRKKHKTIEESQDLNNTNLDSSEFSLPSEKRNKHKKNRNLSISSDLNTTEGFADNSKIISDEKHRKKHKTIKESQDLNNTNLDSSEFSLPSEKRKKHKKNLNLSITETPTVFDNSEITSTNHRKKNIKEGEENHNLSTVDTVNNFNNSEIALTKKQRKKNKDKENKNLRIEENFNKDVNENYERHQFGNNKQSTPNNMIKGNNKDSNHINETNDCQLSVLNSKSVIIRNSEINEVSTDESDADNFDQSSCESSIEEHKRKKIKVCPLQLDLTEDFLEFEVPPLHKTENVQRLTEIQRKNLESENVFIKTGKFSSKEDEIIKRNFENFTKRNGVSDPFLLLGIGSIVCDKNTFKFIKAKHFYAQLGKDLNDRTLCSIYKRARKIIHPYRTEQRFDETEISMMKKIHEVGNKKWDHIGELLERSGDNCSDAYRWHEKPISKGKWTEKEKNELIKGIKAVSGSSNLSFDKIKGISWSQVAEYVPTRNFSQCRQHWSDYFGWKPGAEKQKWNKKCYVTLLQILSKEWNVEDASQIDWSKVYESFVDFAPSYVFVQRRWYYLRYRVPNYKNLNYKDTLKFLCKKYKIS